MAACNICYKRVLLHSYHLKCDSCSSKVHINCLKMVRKDDSLYVNRNEQVWFCPKCCENIFPFNHIDDDSLFIEALAENWNWPMNIPLEALLDTNRLFSPFELNEHVNSPLFDADPDINFYHNQCSNSINSCDYYLEDSFSKKISEKNITPGDCLSMIHVNSRSAVRNFDNLCNYLEGLGHDFPILGMSETWFKPHNKDFYGIRGYTAEHNCRESRRGGGVSIYIKEHIEFSLREDLNQNDNIIESIFIEIDKDQFNKDKNIIVGVIYRPPGTDIKEFNEVMLELLSKLKSERKLIYLMGDFNINLLNADKHAPTQEFADLMFSHSFMPCILKPSRISRR